ncbi:MAG: hypothetical protein A2007_00465, partial [Verrucomicrobia bacterium GWC2_42_7]
QTGQRITSPTDDPAAASRVLQEQTLKDRLSQFYQNESRAENVANVTSSYLQTQIDINTSATEEAIRASGISDVSQFTSSATQVNGLIEQAFATANQQYLGSYLFSGVRTGTQPFTAERDSSGQITSVTYNGTPSGGSQQTYSVAEGITISPYASGDINQNTVLPHIQNLIQLRDHLKNKDSAAITADIQTLRTSSDNLINAQSLTNANLSRLSLAKTQNSNSFQSLEKEISSDADADFAQTMVQLQKTQYAYQAAMQVGGRVLSRSIMDYL